MALIFDEFSAATIHFMCQDFSFLVGMAVVGCAKQLQGDNLNYVKIVSKFNCAKEFK